MRTILLTVLFTLFVLPGCAEDNAESLQTRVVEKTLEQGEFNSGSYTKLTEHELHEALNGPDGKLAAKNSAIKNAAPSRHHKKTLKKKYTGSFVYSDFESAWRAEKRTLGAMSREQVVQERRKFKLNYFKGVK